MGVGEGRTLSLSSCRIDQFKAHQALANTRHDVVACAYGTPRECMMGVFCVCGESSQLHHQRQKGKENVIGTTIGGLLEPMGKTGQVFEMHSTEDSSKQPTRQRKGGERLLI
jgi:hypothetical protein